MNASLKTPGFHGLAYLILNELSPLRHNSVPSTCLYPGPSPTPHPAAMVSPWQPSSLTCVLIIPIKVLPSFAVAEEAFEDGVGDGQHHGSGGRVAQPHGQE